MGNKAYWVSLGTRASQDVFAWSAFVAQTEFLWQDTDLVTDADAWQRLWFELEIVNGLALAEWDDQGRPADGACHWRETYQQDAAALTSELLAMMCDSDSATKP